MTFARFVRGLVFMSDASRLVSWVAVTKTRMKAGRSILTDSNQNGEPREQMRVNS